MRLQTGLWIGGGVLLDQFAKWIMVTFFVTKLWSIWGHPVGFYIVYNRGIAFGLFQGAAFWAGMISVACLIGLMLFYPALKPWFQTWGFRLIVMGALGNGIDRLWHGYVIDFIMVGSFPVFNLADIYLTLGFVLMVVQWYCRYRD